MIIEVSTSKDYIFNGTDKEIYDYDFEEYENLYFKYPVAEKTGLTDEFKEIGEIIHILSGKYMIDFTNITWEKNQSVCSLEFTIWEKKKK